MQLRCREPCQDFEILGGFFQAGFTSLRKQSPSGSISGCQFPVLKRFLRFRQAPPSRLRCIERIAQPSIDWLFSLEINTKCEVSGYGGLQLFHDASAIISPSSAD